MVSATPSSAASSTPTAGAIASAPVHGQGDAGGRLARVPHAGMPRRAGAVGLADRPVTDAGQLSGGGRLAAAQRGRRPAAPLGYLTGGEDVSSRT